VDRFAARIEFPDDVVAVARAAAGLALGHAASETAPGLEGEVLEEERVHRALEPDPAPDRNVAGLWPRAHHRRRCPSPPERRELGDHLSGAKRLELRAAEGRECKTLIVVVFAIGKVV
jgi:hypothetical protein